MVLLDQHQYKFQGIIRQHQPLGSFLGSPLVKKIDRNVEGVIPSAPPDVTQHKNSKNIFVNTPEAASQLLNSPRASSFYGKLILVVEVGHLLNKKM